jgi:hypothetical protein
VIHDFASVPPRDLRVEWRVLSVRDGWRRGPKQRSFARARDTLRFLKRLELAGYVAVIQWREVRQWHWSEVEHIEHRLGPATVCRIEQEAAQAHQRRLQKTRRRTATTEQLPEPRVSEED